MLSTTISCFHEVLNASRGGRDIRVPHAFVCVRFDWDMFNLQ